MVESIVTAKMCIVCKNLLASNVENCIHCGGSQLIAPASYTDLDDAAWTGQQSSWLDKKHNSASQWEVPLEERQNSRQPPLSAQRLRDWTFPPGKAKELAGDIDEYYRVKVLPRDGQIWADYWYWRQTLGAILPLWRRAIWVRMKTIGIVAVVARAIAWILEKISS